MTHSDFKALSPTAEPSLPNAARIVAAVTGAYAVIGALVTFVGWSADLPRLTDWNNDGISMFPNTAACTAMGGLALLLLVSGRRTPARVAAARVLAASMALIGFLTLFEHVTDINLGIDTLLFKEKSWGQRASASPMRMGPPASVSFAILGCAIFLTTFTSECRRFGSELALLVVVIASLSLTGYWFGADQLFGIARLTGIAWQTSVSLMALSIGLMASVPEHGFAAALSRDDAGGTVLRRLIVPIILIPLAMGWLRLIGQEANLFDLAFGTAIRTVGEIVLLFGLLWWTANGISQHAKAAHRAEQARRESESRFRLMADAAPVLMWIADPRKQRTWFNKQWLEFVGRPIEHELGSGWVENVHPDDVDRCLSIYNRSFESRQSFSTEYRLRRHDGVYRWVLDNGVPRYDSANTFAGFIGSCVDISERKLAEDNARTSDRRKDEFLATLAHELRNPLAPIGNALQLIQYADGNSEMLHTARDTMQRQFAHMVRLVDDLLDVGRITRDKLELRKERVELQSVILQAVETSRPIVDAARQALDVDLPLEPIWLDADPVRLSQVFNNLLNNASKFTETGGTISIEVNRDEAFVTAAVRDSGIGIAPEKLDSIFAMFEQIDKSLERTRGGLGIGLTLVKRLVELHNGEITASSRGLDQGSEFVVRLPVVAEPPSVNLEKPAKGRRAAGAKRILVTDDNRDAAKSLGMILRIAGHEVEIAYDGPEAVQKAEAFQPDVILLDIGLPGMSGYDVCRAIRRQSWGKQIRIIALTGWGQEQDRHNTREAGFDHHLVKPVAKSELDNVLAATKA